MSSQPRPAARASRRVALFLTALAALAAALPGPVAAATTAQVVARTEDTWLQTCSPQALDVLCTGPTSRVHIWTARIRPVSGPVTQLSTASELFAGPPLDPESRAWMTDLQSLVCGSEKEMASFIDAVANLKVGGGVGPTAIGICTVTGSHLLSRQGRSLFRVVSSVPPPPTPAPPTATPTAIPTPTPTTPARPTPTALATAAPTTEPSLAAEATPTVAPASSATVAPSASASAAPSTSPAAEPSPAGPTPAPTAGGGAGNPPSPGPSAAPVAATPAPSLPAWESSVLGIEEVNTDGGAAGGSLLLVLLLLAIIGFIAELFNNTVENNYDEIAGWFGKGPLGKVRGALSRVRIDLPGRPGVLGFIALTALVSSFVDPGFGLNVRSVAVFLGFLVGLIVVLASFKLPPILARRRKTGELAQLRPLPWALAIAALFVIVSRVAQLQPGYLYGIVLGAIFVSDVSDRDEGRETSYGALWTLVAAILAWVALTWLRGLGLPADGFGMTLLSTAFAATLVAGLEAAAFALMPLRFLPGYVIYKWNRLAWAVLWGVSLFAFVHILIGPMSGYVAELSPGAFLAALGVFAAFGALSIATWLYFRFRHPPGPEAVEAG